MSDGLTALEVPLIVLHAAGGKVVGKTVLQKLTYFVAARERLNLGYSPHHYGPYSKRVQDAVETLVGAGEVRATTVALGVNRDGWPIRETTYELTDTGTELAGQLASSNPDVASRTATLIESLRQWATLSQDPLSVAAKVHYMLRSGKTVTPESLVGAAKGLGWAINMAAARQALDLVRSLDLVS